MRTARWLVATLILALGSGHAVVSAQVTTADLVGRVTDNSGAVLPGVTVTVTQTGTGATRTQTTSDTGDYAFNLLPIGPYEIKLELQGFKTQLGQSTLSAGQRARFDGRLELGSVNETIQVTAEVPLLQTDSVTVGALLTDKAILDSPAPERNIYRLLTLVPGATEGAVSSSINGTRPDERRQTAALSVNGAGDIENNQMIDGADNNERLMGTAGIRVSIDAVAEVKIQTNLYAAETGRTNGGVINVITKSGTNKLSGSAYDFVRRGRFDSRTYFATVDPDRKQDQFGGSLGGPLKTNRTFFFADYEGYRLKEGQPNLITVPTPAMLRGDFSALLPNTIIYDPTTTPRTPFAGNIIPANRISPIARQLVSLYPTPTTPGLVSNFFNQTQRTQDSDTVDVKVDHHFTQNDSAFVRYSYNGVSTFTPGACPIVNGIDPSCVTAGVGGGGTFPGPNDTSVHGVQGNFVRVLNPTLVAEVRGGYLNLRIGSFPPNEGTFASDKLGIINGNLPGDKASGLAAITVTGYAFLGDQGFLPIAYHDVTKQISGVVTKTAGAHNVKVGSAFIVRDAQKRGVGGSPSGNYTFDAALTSSGPQGSGGNAVASMLLGYPSAATRNFEQVIPNYHSLEPSVFAQDDWHARSWLTVNYGVRYDVYTPLTEANDYISNFDLASAKILVANKDGVDRAVGVKTDWSNVAPRVGMSATLPARMVLRGGFGLTYFPTNMHSPALFRNPPFISAYGGPTINLGPSGGVPTLFLSDGFPLPEPVSFTNPPGAIAGVDQNFKAMRTRQFNAILEKEVGSNNVVSIGYVGSRSDRAVGSVLGAGGANYNLAPLAAGNVQTRRPYFSRLPLATNITMRESKYHQWYDSLQLQFQRRYRAGLMFTTHYTWANGEWDSWAPWDISITERFPNPLLIRHRFVATVSYELPGQNLGGAAGALLGGWQANLGAFAQSGLPYDISNAVSRTNTGGTDRPDMVCDPNLSSDERTLTRWFNTACFVPETMLTAGNTPRNVMTGPSAKRMDLSFFKNINLAASRRVQLRWEIYNLTNTPVFNVPGSQLGTPTFGVISNVGNSIARQMQFAARFTF